MKKNKTDKRLEEIKKIAEKADKTKGYKLDFKDQDVSEDDFPMEYLNYTHDPDKSHKLYYTMRAILVENLPKGPENKKLREFIYEEKNIFLNRGKKLDENGIRGSDGRMAHAPSHINIAFNAVVEWVAEGSGSWEIYLKFNDLNEKYGHNQEQIEQADFNKKLITAIKNENAKKDEQG